MYVQPVLSWESWRLSSTELSVNGLKDNGIYTTQFFILLCSKTPYHPRLNYSHKYNKVYPLFNKVSRGANNIMLRQLSNPSYVHKQLSTWCSPSSPCRCAMSLSLWTNSAAGTWQESRSSPSLATPVTASPTRSTTSCSVVRVCSTRPSPPAPVRWECGPHMTPPSAWSPWILRAYWGLHPIRTREWGSCWR